MATNTLDKVDSLPNTEIEQVDKNLPTDCLYIFTDIETESFLAFLILQIAAVTSEGHQFNSFINPCRPLSEFCTNFLGFSFSKADFLETADFCQQNQLSKLLRNSHTGLAILTDLLY